MPYVWFRCRGCGERLQRWCNSKTHYRRQRICGRLVRCDPPPDPEPGSREWLEARALQHLIVRE